MISLRGFVNVSARRMEIVTPGRQPVISTVYSVSTGTKRQMSTMEARSKEGARPGGDLARLAVSRLKDALMFDDTTVKAEETRRCSARLGIVGRTPFIAPWE